jgi:hypothetical protein
MLQQARVEQLRRVLEVAVGGDELKSCSGEGHVIGVGAARPRQEAGDPVDHPAQALRGPVTPRQPPGDAHVPGMGNSDGAIEPASNAATSRASSSMRPAPSRVVRRINAIEYLLMRSLDDADLQALERIVAALDALDSAEAASLSTPDR